MKHHGWIILDKPLELGSTQAVGAVKRNLREAGLLGKGKDKLKVGHGGTLDPLASGILPIALGEATKLCGRMLDASKIYEFTIQFGIETETLDSEGDVSETSDVRPTLAHIEYALADFTGDIEQIPPKYSALKIDGKRAYDLARSGVDVEMKMRNVTIYGLNIVHPDSNHSGAAKQDYETANNHIKNTHRHPEFISGSHDNKILKQVQYDDIKDNDEAAVLNQVQHDDFNDDDLHKPSVRPELVEGQDTQKLEQITLRAHVSKGTYIRSLARDIARNVGTVGHVTMLRRIKAGPFSLKHAISLDKLNEIGQGAPLKDIILPMEAALDDTPALILSPEQAKAIQQGRVLTGIAGDNGHYLAKDENDVPLALVDLSNTEIRVIRGFNF